MAPVMTRIFSTLATLNIVALVAAFGAGVVSRFLGAGMHRVMTLSTWFTLYSAWPRSSAFCWCIAWL